MSPAPRGRALRGRRRRAARRGRGAWRRRGPRSGSGARRRRRGPVPGVRRNAPNTAPEPGGALRRPCVPSGPSSGLTRADGRRIVQRRPLFFTMSSHSPFICKYAPTDPAPNELRRRKRRTFAAMEPSTSCRAEAMSLDSYVSPALNRFRIVPTNETTTSHLAIASVERCSAREIEDPRARVLRQGRLFRRLWADVQHEVVPVGGGLGDEHATGRPRGPRDEDSHARTIHRRARWPHVAPVVRTRRIVYSDT